jgi:TRAP transporter TAXI family solute receptor
MVRKAFVVRLRSISWRDAVFVALPALLLLVAGFWGAAQFIRPAPPSRLVIGTGEAGGGYQRYAAEYRKIFARYGIDLIERPTSGSVENIALLRDESEAADVAFVQGGTADVREDEAIYSLGAIGYEPLWIFYRETDLHATPLTRVAQLKGRRIAVGGIKSGTRELALEILSANNLNASNTRLKDIGGMQAALALSQGRVDAAFLVGPVRSAATWTLLFAPGIRLIRLENADAYVRMMPQLSKIVLPAGAVDLVRNIPSSDVTLLAPMATVAVGGWTHPALVDMLIQAIAEVHGRPDLLYRAGEFPKAQAVDFPLADQAVHFYTSGKPLLQRYLPFWAATFIDRMVVMLIPVVALLFPLLKVAPTVYGW